MKTIQYFKRHDIKPKGAVYLCVTKKIVKSNKVYPVYEDVYVYECPDDSYPKREKIKIIRAENVKKVI